MSLMKAEQTINFFYRKLSKIMLSQGKNELKREKKKKSFHRPFISYYINFDRFNQINHKKKN